jgi:hypothetical protein
LTLVGHPKTSNIGVVGAERFPCSDKGRANGIVIDNGRFYSPLNRKKPFATGSEVLDFSYPFSP